MNFSDGCGEHAREAHELVLRRAKPTIKTDEGIKAREQAWRVCEELVGDALDRGHGAVDGSGPAEPGPELCAQRPGAFSDRKAGKVTAKVQGSRSRPYSVTIEVKPLTDGQWRRVIDALAARPIFMAQLLAGEMPQDIEEAFADANLSLFPASAGETDPGL